MGIAVSRRVADLGEDLTLAPERFDPRRSVVSTGQHRLGDLLDIVSENVTPRELSLGPAVLVLDTNNAYEGFVVYRHRPVAAAQIGSSKRRVQPGDVLVSRLRPYLRQVAYVDNQLFQLHTDGNPVVASSEFFVLRSSDRCAAAALLPFLLSSAVQTALAAGQEGGHHPRFSRELLASLHVPDTVLAQAAETAAAVRELATALRRSMLGCQALVAAVEAPSDR